MHRRLCAFLVVTFAAISVAGCEAPPFIKPTEPTPTTVSFSGTLTVNGGATHRFTAQAAGTINLRLKTLAPVTTVTVGLWLGVWTGASCNMVLQNENAVLDTVMIGAANASGEFCARVYDVEKLTAPTDYTIEISHF